MGTVMWLQPHHRTKHNDVATTVKSGSSTLQKRRSVKLCWTSSSDISGYLVDFHEGHGTVGAGQGCGISCVN